MFCIAIEHKAVVEIFFSILQKQYIFLFFMLYFFETLCCKLVTLSNLRGLIVSINNDIINLVRHFDAQSIEINFQETLFICMQKLNLIFNFFFEIFKYIANLLFWELWECLVIHIKIILSIASKLSYLSACKKSISSINSFLRYCREIANMFFFSNLGMPGQMHLK